MVELKNASAIVITVVIFAIILGIGGTILGDLEQNECEKGDSCAGGSGTAAWNGTALRCYCSNSTSPYGDIPTSAAGTYALNATQSGLEGVGTMSDWIPTISVIIVSALVIGIIGAYFYMRR